MKSLRLSFLAITLFLTISSCNKQKIELIKLKTYFKTNDVSAKVRFDTLEVEVKNSKLVEETQKRLGANWVSAEPISSIGAINTVEIIDEANVTTVNIIVINVITGYKSRKYNFRIDEVRKVTHFFKKCKEFAKVKFKTNLDSIASLVSPKISRSSSRSNVEDLLNHTFLNESVDNVDLVAFKVGKGTVTLFVNYVYNSGPQTYGFTFDLDGDNLIEGITIIR